jgi:metallo-beta-lactamase family protein
MASLQFLGATQCVTGSKYLLEADGTKLMIDCGLFQGEKELRLRNWNRLPVRAGDIDFVALTHGHIDHTGYLPRLINAGFRGRVYATKGTADMLGVVLPDSGHLQEEEAEFANRKGYSKHHPALPLYTEEDARRALAQVRGFNYDEPIRLNDAITIRFVPAGHILGSSFIIADVTERGRDPFRIVFSGDLGRFDEPILKDPTLIEKTDYLLVESTYGDRVHEDHDPKERLAEIINATIRRGGKVVIPAFAIGRTQLLIYYIHELEAEGRIPSVPVIVDSPMASATTRLYIKHTEDHDEEMRAAAELHRNPLMTKKFRFVDSAAESRELCESDEPMIVISASGMANGGRILHHLAAALPHEKNTIVFVGYQAEGTRGRRLLQGEQEIKIHGEMIPVVARVEKMGSLSAHADSNEVLRWLGSFKQTPKTLFIVHGEPKAQEVLRDRIRKELHWHIEVPRYEQKFQL